MDQTMIKAKKGSALGSVIFGTLTVWIDIRQTVGVVGGLCVASALIVLIAFRKKAFHDPGCPKLLYMKVQVR